MCSDLYKQNAIFHDYLKICRAYATGIVLQGERLSTPAIQRVSSENMSDNGINSGEARPRNLLSHATPELFVPTAARCMIGIPAN